MLPFIANYSYSFFVSLLTVHWKKVIFKRTMRKFLNESGDLQLPNGILHIIENYFTMYAVKTVEKIEFNLLKRVVHLMDKKYRDGIKNLALGVHGWCLYTSKDRGALLQEFVQHGLMEKLKMTVSLLHARGIRNGNDVSTQIYRQLARCVLDLLSHDSRYRSEIIRCDLIVQMTEIAMDHSSQIKTATRGLCFLSQVVRLRDMRAYCHDHGIMIAIFDLLLVAIAGIKLDERLRRHPRAAVQSILQFDEANGRKMRQLFTERLETYDRSKIKPGNSVFFEELVSNISKRTKAMPRIGVEYIITQFK